MAEKAVKMEAKAEQPPKMATRKPPRQMAAKACERCRRRKIKCDEFFPCGQCTRMRVQCKIEDPAEKRREQQQSAMEDRIKRLEALLIAAYSNPKNHLDMNNAGIDLEGLLPGLGGSPQAISQGAKMEPPRLTIQTPASPDFRPQESNDQLLSAGGYAFGIPYWSPPPSIAQSAPTSATDYYGSDLPPWSTVATQGGSNDSTPPGHSPRPIRTRTSSMSTSEASQDDMRSPILGGDRNRLSVDTSGSTLAVPQIAITSWDQSRPQSPAPGGVSPALSPQASVMDIDMSIYDTPDLSVGSWSGLSSPSIMAPIYPYEDHLSVTNQSLPSHSRRSSINSLTPDYEMYNEPKRRRAISDLLPVSQQFIYSDSGSNSEFFTSPTATPQNRPGTPNLYPLPIASPIIPPQRARQDSLGSSHGHQHKEEILTQTFTEVIYPLFPLLSSASQQQPQLSPAIAQTQTYLVCAISTHLLSLRPQSPAQAQKSSFTPQAAQTYFSHAMHLHGHGKWDSLPGIQSGILLALYILLSPTSFQSSSAPNLYLLNATIVAACLDLGLHQCRNLNEGALDGNTLLAAYVLDKTIARIRARPALLKETDLSPEALGFINRQLAERSRNGSVRRFPEGGRLWEWWAQYEGGLRAGNVELEMDALTDHDFRFSG